MNFYKLTIALVPLFLISCNSKINEGTYAQFQKKGNEISNQAQATLLANVGKAMQTGGPAYAVEFCNLKASSVIDSLNSANSCLISRISVKNRNSGNSLKSADEEKLYKIFESGMAGDTIIVKNKKLVYYKSIHIAMAACLKCHGEPGSDMDMATTGKLRELYPADLATGYKLNDFRGLWKIEFEAN